MHSLCNNRKCVNLILKERDRGSKVRRLRTFSFLARFYQVLHQFLKRWPRSKSSTKSSIGRFYMAIDKNLQAKGCRPDNTYLFIEKVALSSQSSQSSLMCYGNEKLEGKMLQGQVKECCENIEQMMKDFGAMSEE